MQNSQIPGTETVRGVKVHSPLAVYVLAIDPRMHQTIIREGVSDEVAVEEPLEIRAEGKPIAVTMRTPGNDQELALGFLYGEGLIDRAHRVELPADFAANAIEVDGPLLAEPGTRNFYATSSCGVCGKGALEEVAVHSEPTKPGPVVARSTLAGLTERVSQPAFELTGGLHASALFDSQGKLICLREDVGRHNALDKVVGWALGQGRVPLANSIIWASGRLSFELVQKAAVAGAPFLVGVGAPSSLAISLAADRRMTLCGFARAGTLNVYAGTERVG